MAWVEFAPTDPEPTECEVWPWHELEYAMFVADSDRILADALTPQPVVLLEQVGCRCTDAAHPHPDWDASWGPAPAPVGEIRAKQRSPPSAGGAELACSPRW